MKKIFLNLTVFLGLVTIISCGPSAEEIAKNEAKEKAKMDSIAKVSAENAIAAEKAKQDSIAALEARSVNQANLKQSLIELKAKLAGEEEKMKGIQNFQLGRSASEKEQQVTNQTRVIEELKRQIEEVEKQID